MNRRRFFSAFAVGPALSLSLLVLCAPTSRAQQAEISEEVSLRIEERCNEYLWGLYEEKGFPGLSAALVLPDGTELSFPIGFADVEAERDMAPSDRLLSGSIGKTRPGR